MSLFNRCFAFDNKKNGCEKADIFSQWRILSEDFSLIEKMRYPVSFPDKDINYYLKMLKGEIEEKHKLKPVLKSFPERGTVILFTSRDLGGGEPSYSKKLMERFIFAISRASVKPRMIISLNEAVFFMAEDSPILDSLRILEKQEVQIYVSSSCAEYYKCSDDIKIGKLIEIGRAHV